MLARTGLLLLVLPGILLAQDEKPGRDEAAPVEEIIVTGSRLPRRDFSAPSPIATLDEEALTFSGQATLEEALNNMPQVAPDFGRTSNNPGDGTATVNLRGLGAERTLVLLNGRRLAPSGVGSAADINNLPQALMERVEIITGGATTVYGADAVAGVVNFITRSDFEGFGIDASAYVTEEGDSNINDINVTYGLNFADGRGNVTLYGGYYDREATYASQRDFTSETIVDFWDGTLGPGGSSINPSGLLISPRVDIGTGTPERLIFDEAGNPRPYDPTQDYYNYAPGNYLQVPLERTSYGAMFTLELSDIVEFYGEASVAENDASQNLAPVPAFGFFSINPDNPALTPQMQQIAADEFFPLEPGLVGAVLARRLAELGPRTILKQNEYRRFVAGLRGEINEVWEFDAWATWTKAHEDEFFLNDASSARLQQALLVDPATGECFDPSDGCVAANIFGAGNLSQAALDYIRYDPFRNVTKRDQTLISGFVRGAPLSTWAGPVNMAFGVEMRRDSGSFTADPILFSDDTLGFRARASVNGKETVHEFYTEASVPLAEGANWAEYLGVELGARFSDYDNAGVVRTWKIGAEWDTPLPIRFRTMLQESVRAPNLQEAFTEQGSEQGTFVGNSNDFDPCSAVNDPVGNGYADACIASGLPASEVGTWTATIGYPSIRLFGGNPEVKPETAKTFTAGFVVDVDWMQGMQLSVDYFDLKIEDSIGELDVGLACYDTANTGQLFCDRITRNPLNYNVERVDAKIVNRGRFQVRGVDTQLSLETRFDLSMNLVWTHSFENSYQETAFGTVFDCNGTFGWPCNFSRFTSVYPENRIYSNLSWVRGDFTARLAYRWIQGTINGLTPYGDQIGLPPGSILGLKKVGDKDYFDLAFGYQVTDNIAARLTIANLADSEAPLMADYSFGNNTDPRIYDLFGRSYTLALSLRF